jgi:cytochrome c553
MSKKKLLLIGLLVALQCPLAAAQPAAGVSERMAAAQKDAALTASLQKTGRRVAGSVCANCHGEGGNSVLPDVPNLAGQNQAYLLEQIRSFSDGKRRNSFMEGIMKALTADEKVGIVLFFSSQEVVPKPYGNSAMVERGAQYFKKVCVACHGDAGRGNEQIARIAGQQLTYLRTTLHHFRDSVGVRTNPLMIKVAKAMTDDEIDAVTAYVSSMK